MTVGPTAVDVARGFAERIGAERRAADEVRAHAVSTLASELQRRIEAELGRLGEQLRDAFADIDPAVHYSVQSKSPSEPEARYWYGQLVRAAKASNFFANILVDGSWWVRLRLVVLRQELLYVVSTQKVGHGKTGILAVTIFSELVPPRVPTRATTTDEADDALATDEESELSPSTLLFSSSSEDLITLNRTDTVDDRWVEACELVERTLAASVAEFGRLLG